MSKPTNPTRSLAHLLAGLVSTWDDSPADTEQQRLLQGWNEYVGIIATHSQPLLFRSGRLVVFCDSPASATQLRHQIPSLHRQLREQQFTVTDIVAKLHWPATQPSTTHADAWNKPRALSPTAATALHQSAQTIKHAALSAAIKRLARKPSTKRPTA